MGRELIITMYLLMIKGIFNLFKLFPLKNKVVFLVSFGDNSKYIFEEMTNQGIEVETVVLYKGSSKNYFLDNENIKLVPFESYNLFHFLLSIYHLATSKYIFVDNYFGILSATNFKDEVEVIQLWHASGAIKKFGLQDQSVDFRSERAKQRFQRVYNNFHKVVVGSDVMANIFKKAFNISNDRIVRTGIPRTDFFFNHELHHDIILKLVQENPDLKYKKKILYAPTYRDNELDYFKLELDLEKMYHEMKDEYVIILRLHPAIKNTVNYSELYPNFVYDYSSSNYDINELLLIANYLVTDYSSIPYEYSLLNRPMIFFAYDLEEYKAERGLWDQYESMVPGPVVKETEALITLIKDNKFNTELMKNYAVKWNKYSRGHSSESLVKYIFVREQYGEQAKSMGF